jgi:lactobin A/cerein 7B family class IIb bacteriocin
MVELKKDELKKVNGGFIPLVIFGVTYSAQLVAGAIGSAFIAGFGGGIMIASMLDAK